MTSSSVHLVVGRLRKPHGLKGDCAVYPLTDNPDEVFAPGKSVWLMGIDGVVEAGPLVIARSRGYHREFLIAFEGHLDRAAIEGWRDRLISVPARELKPPADGEVYLHELAGFAVVDLQGDALGVVTEVEELPSGIILEVQGPKREFLLPFRREFVREVDRERRRLMVDPPSGLIEG